MTLSVAQLKKALSIRITIDKLDAKINRLHNQLDEIMDGEAIQTKVVIRQKVKVQKKVKNKGGITLKDMLVKILEAAGKPQNIDRIVMGLKKSNYRTASKDIKKIVGVRLYSGKEFLKTSPGMFTLKAIGTTVSKKASKTIVKK